MATAPITEPARPRIAAIVVNYRTPALALACIDALAAERADRPDLRVMLVDGGSGDDSPAILAAGLEARGASSWVELLALPINGGFGYANNQALLRLAAGSMPPDYVALVNPDAEVEPGALGLLADLLDGHPRAAAVGALLVASDGRAQGSAFTFPTPFGELSRGASTDLVRRLTRTPPVALAPEAPAAVPWVTGAAVMLRMAALAEAGLFDDGFFLYFEEVELMHRLRRAGWEIWHEPRARVAHVGGQSTEVSWDEAGFGGAGPLPAYWYRSRRRYFARTAGPAAAAFAALAFVAGRLLWLARTRIQRRPDRFPQRMARDMLRHGCLPGRGDAAPARLPRLGDPPGAPPAWMRTDQDR